MVKGFQPLPVAIIVRVIVIAGMVRGAPSCDEGVSYRGLYVCLVIPGLVVGTVGGGTQLATQKECLSMMGCYGKVSTGPLGITCHI